MGLLEGFDMSYVGDDDVGVFYLINICGINKHLFEAIDIGALFGTDNDRVTVVLISRVGDDVGFVVYLNDMFAGKRCEVDVNVGLFGHYFREYLLCR